MPMIQGYLTRQPLRKPMTSDWETRSRKAKPESAAL